MSGADGAGEGAGAGEAVAPRPQAPVVAALGIGQILAWGSTYYLPAVLAGPIAADTGWPLAWVVGGLSVGLLAGGCASGAVGRRIDRLGGRPVLGGGTLLVAAGLAALAWAPTLPLYLAAWAILGLGMAAALYDAAFAALGRLYGARARAAITNLTLIGGLASTLCWPLSAALLDAFGWRGTCLAYAGLQLAVVLPAYALGLPREARPPRRPGPEAPSGRKVPAGTFLPLAACLTLGAAVSSAVSVHLLAILQARDLGLAAAVALGALVGPSQVAARVVERLAGERHHPVWTLVASSLLTAAGLGALALGLPFPSACLVLYGAGVGIRSICRGTLPLALFGPDGYAALMGRLAAASLVAQAAAPSLGAVLMERAGAAGTTAALAAAALVALVLSLALVPVAARRHAPAGGASA